MIEDLINNENTGEDTYWSDGITTITLKDLNEYLLDTEVEYLNPKELKYLLVEGERKQERIKNADLEYPIIIAKQCGKFAKILDGHHRVIKAIQNNVGEIKTKIIDLDKAPNDYKRIFNLFIILEVLDKFEHRGITVSDDLNQNILMEIMKNN